jgi:hypothetical protein
MAARSLSIISLAHAAALHQRHQRWGLTSFQVQPTLLGVPAEARVGVRLEKPELISSERADRVRDEMREPAYPGGFSLRPDSTPSFTAVVRSPDDARKASELAGRCRAAACRCCWTGLRRATG